MFIDRGFDRDLSRKPMIDDLFMLYFSFATSIGAVQQGIIHSVTS